MYGAHPPHRGPSCSSSGWIADDIDLVVKTLKEFTEREAPLDKRLEWDRTDTCPADVVRAMLGAGRGAAPRVPARGARRHGRRRLRRLPPLDGVRQGRPRPRHRDAGRRPRHRSRSASAARDEQKAKWLTRIAEEGLIVAYGVTEPEAGSNVQNLKTEATRVTDADGRVTHYRLNGVKQFISNGSIADLYTILAKAPGRPDVLRRRAQHAGPDAGTARDQARHPPVGHGPGPARRTSSSPPITSSAPARAKGSSRRTRCSASPG